MQTPGKVARSAARITRVFGSDQVWSLAPTKEGNTIIVAARGVTVVTLVSDVPGSKRMHYAGIDNAAAGRTAASLLGRFAGGRQGKVAVLAGSMLVAPAMAQTVQGIGVAEAATQHALAYAAEETTGYIIGAYT